MTTIAVVDTETTGLAAHDEPISLGVIVVKVDERGAVMSELGRYYGLQCPSVPIHPIAKKVHGLDASSLAGQRFDVDRITELFAMAEVAIAHNASFDSRMVRKITAMPIAWRCTLRQFPWRGVEGQKLDDVCRAFAVPRPQPHSALQDCEALLACLVRHTGKTDRSRTYLGALLAEKPYPTSDGIRPIKTRPPQGSRDPLIVRVEASLAPRLSAPRPSRREGVAFALGSSIGRLWRSLFG